MKICIDSCGWIEFFMNEENSDFFGKKILDTEIEIIVPALIIFEVYKIILTYYTKKDALRALTLLKKQTSIPITDDIALSAVFLSKEYQLGFADSLILATAQNEKATLFTQDCDFKNIPGVEYIQKK